MTDQPRIVFGDTKIETTQNKAPQKHWLIEYQDHLVKNRLLTNDVCNSLINNLDSEEPNTDVLKERIKNWLTPQVGFGETTNPIDNINGFNKYLVRVIYEEMFQISQPDNTGSQITSAGGLISHISPDAKPSKRDVDKYETNLILASIRTRDAFSNELNMQLSANSRELLKDSLGIKETEIPLTVDECFTKTWSVLKDDIVDVMQSQDNNVINEYLKKVVAVRSIAEFQFLFKSPFFWITIEKQKG